MELLAFETATRRISVAWWRDGEWLERSGDLPNSGSEVLLPWAAEVLAEAGSGLRRLDGIAFGAGPGSFTGLRLACGVAQGVAWGLDVPVVAVPTLAALALASGEALCWTVLDARMNEVYSAAYSVDGDAVTERASPVCTPPAELPAPPFAGGVGVGDGFTRYADALRMRKPDLHAVRAGLWPTAVAVARLAATPLSNGEGVPAGLAQPMYVRDKVALTTAERLARGGAR